MRPVRQPLRRFPEVGLPLLIERRLFAGLPVLARDMAAQGREMVFKAVGLIGDLDSAASILARAAASCSCSISVSLAGQKLPIDSRNFISTGFTCAEVADILDALSPVHREVLHLRYREQCTFIKIGIRMNRSPEAARKLWYRAVGEFKTLLGRRRA